MILAFLYILLAIYILFNLEKVPSNGALELSHFDVSEPVIRTLPKRAVKDNHWYIKTFLRSRRKKG